MALWCKINDSWCISMHYSIFCLRAYLLLIFSLFILSFSYSCCHCVRLLTRCLSMLRRHFCVCICACAVRLVNRHAADDNINYLITRSLTPQRALYEHIIAAITSSDTNAWMTAAATCTCDINNNSCRWRVVTRDVWRCTRWPPTTTASTGTWSRTSSITRHGAP